MALVDYPNQSSKVSAYKVQKITSDECTVVEMIPTLV